MYRHVIHPVDHIKGLLRRGYDALAAFLTHMWAVTVTGAPKMWAMQFIEDNEDAPRRWYGGAGGQIRLGGSVDTRRTPPTAHLPRGGPPGGGRAAPPFRPRPPPPRRGAPTTAPPP